MKKLHMSNKGSPVTALIGSHPAVGSDIARGML